ncbi:Putative HNH endonuclease [Modestobacter italicus]|uniref:HNH endonuclease n=1 Tax=Modestobacter italicus (strain DSM 44449 / CECT 9708 / BC 501) TaxID=2732864 RepID=I4F4X2_MODI5|nr:HNH endonuclease signature motif containing protein [Modestobacter marinus]CCH90685.1 Putative HNH endonuclease [Modestobacter marinus]
MTGAGVQVLVDLVWEHPVIRPRPPVSWLSDEERAVELQRAQQQQARIAAYEAELIMSMAAARPATDDPAPGTPGARRPGWAVDEGYDGPSEFFTAELSAVLNVGRGTAAHRYARAHTWLTKLPATFAALAAGELDERRAAQLAEVLQHTSAEVAGQVEAALLPEATDLAVTRLKAKATELMVQLDAAAADQRRKEADKAADVHLYPSASDGRATLAADLPAEEAVECYDIVDQLAKMLKADGDPRRIGALRAHVLSLLIRRPADNGLPPVSANVTVTADVDSLGGTGSSAGEVNGLPITAAHVRELLARVSSLGLTAPDGGTLSFAITGPNGELLATLTPAELTRLARRGCTTHPDSQCACPVTGPPPATDAYEPTDRQRAFVTTRDRRCRFPNCGQRVGWADLDHVIPAACGGATDCANLCCLCRSHHRLKTFAPGWHFAMTDDGVLTVTTPSGVTRTTRPPGMRPPPAPAGPEPPQSADDPPPF